MVKRSAGRPGVVEDRLLRKMTEAARVAGRSRGRARMRAMARYIAALHRFTDCVIGSLQSRASMRRQR